MPHDPPPLFRPETHPPGAPLPDLGLRCPACEYPLAALSEPVCPECGTAFSLEALVPEGATPALIVSGTYLPYAAEALDLLDRYGIPWVRLADPMEVLNHPGINTNLNTRVGVGPGDYFTAIDLLRRAALNEPLPEPPAEPADTGPWDCGNCGEENPPTFEICWNCGDPAGAGTK